MMQRQSGFTIIELMTVVAVAAILTVMALPYMRDILLNQRVRAGVTEAHLSLLLTRSEAIKRNANIVMQRTGAAWNQGWTVVVQADGTVLRTNNAMADVTFVCNTDANPNTVEACPAQIIFNRTGRPTSKIEYRVYVPGNNKVFMRCVGITLSGQPHVEIDTDGDPTNGCES